MNDYRKENRGGGGGSYSGSGYDRWSYEHSAPGANDTALNKLQHKYWVAKQAVVRKLGKDEDEHVVASDAELDAKLDLFRSINETTSNLQRLIEHYQDRLCNLAYEENSMGRFLKDYGKMDKTKAGKMMVAVGKSMSYSGQQRLAIRSPLVRLYQEVETFHDRAIEDTYKTVKKMEKIRTEYRGALMWMKNVSTELDPDTYKQLEKFRKVQAHVKLSKARFDKLKLDCLQKVDLLAASRCNMFSHALILYQNALILFWEKTAKTMGHVDQSFRGYQYYEFAYIKELAEPSRQLAQKVNAKAKEKSEEEKQQPENAQQPTDNVRDDLLYFNPDYRDDDESLPTEQGVDALELAKQSEQSLNDLLDLKEDEGVGDDDDENILLEIDSQLKQKKKSTAATGSDVNSMFSSMSMNTNDVQLLEDLMSDAPTSNSPSSGFSAQWNKMFGDSSQLQTTSGTIASSDNFLLGKFGGESKKSTSGLVDDEFSNFVSSSSGGVQGQHQGESASSSDLLSLDEKPNHGQAFLPSQLFDLDQSLYAKHSLMSNQTFQDISQFPMPSPARPSSVDLQLAKIKREQEENAAAGGLGEKRKKVTAENSKRNMSEWFSLFADLDPLANPDAIGISTKEADPNCYS